MDHQGVTVASTADGGSGGESPARYVLLGPPASGKGTQGRRLAEHARLDYLSTGALLRREVAAGSALGLAAKVFLDAGNYLPDELMENILAGWLDARRGGWVLDGFPRTLAQACWLDERCGLTAAIALAVPSAVLEQRIADRLECESCRWTTSRGLMGSERHCPRCHGALVSRADDDLPNFRSRHASYVALTVPVIDHYRALGKLIEVDGAGAAEEVFDSLIGRLTHHLHGQAH